jgi:hypothetical protein
MHPATLARRHRRNLRVLLTCPALLLPCAPVPQHVQGLGLVFVAVYQKALSLMYVDELLGLVRDAFTEAYSSSNYNYEAFGSKFNKILRDCEARADAARRNAAVAQVRSFSAKHSRALFVP